MLLNNINSTQAKHKSINLKYLLIYHPNTILMSDVYIILAKVKKNSWAVEPSWAFNFCKVVQQPIRGEVVNFVPAISAVHLRMQQWINY